MGKDSDLFKGLAPGFWPCPGSIREMQIRLGIFSSSFFFFCGGHKDGGADLGGLGSECDGVHYVKFTNIQ